MDNVFLLVEAKSSDKGITNDHVNQAKSYAKELSPAYYIVTNSKQILVFKLFNGLLAQDERVMDFDRSMLDEMWVQLYSHVSKEGTIERKSWILSQLRQD